MTRTISATYAARPYLAAATLDDLHAMLPDHLRALARRLERSGDRLLARGIDPHMAAKLHTTLRSAMHDFAIKREPHVKRRGESLLYALAEWVDARHAELDARGAASVH